MDRYPVAHMVGKECDEFRYLRNTYYITDSGFLVPDTTCFFFDSAANPFSSILGYTDNSKLQASEIKKSTSRKILTELTNKFKECIDEVLAIADPSSSYGIVRTRHKGMYSKDSIGHFNSLALRLLFDKASLELFDLDTLIPLPPLKELEAYWDYLTALQNSYTEKLCADTNCPEMKDPLPRDFKELGILLEND